MDEHSIRKTRATYFQKATSTLDELLVGADAAIWPENLKGQFREAADFFRTRTEFFQIALCGLFQTGKSTTANAIADGREISVASLVSGIRTSACNIYFSGSANEQSSIEFIDDDELSARLSALLDIPVDKEKIWRKETQNRLMQCFRKRWDDSLSKGSDVNGSLVCQAGLMICGLDSFHELRMNIQRGNHAIQDVLSIGQAPENEGVRWQGIRANYKKDPNSLVEDIRRTFPIQEVLYPFVNRIAVQVNSDWMKQTNICIVDMPGLSANAQDTNTAMRAIENADALFYIFDGAKEPGEFERKFISSLQSITKNCPVVFGINWHGFQKNQIKVSIQSLLQESGYENAELISYNALFACRAAQGISIMNGTLDQRTSRKILKAAENVNGAKPDSLADAWADLVSDEMYRINKTIARQIRSDGLCVEVIAELQRLSGWKKVIKSLTQMAGGEQWQAIYRRQIRVPIETSIRDLLEALRTAEETIKSNAESSQNSACNEWSVRQSNVQKLSNQKQADFTLLINESWISAVAKEMWDCFENLLPDIATLITELLTDSERDDNFSEKLEMLLRTAFSNWREAFLHRKTGSSAKVIYDCEQQFVKLSSKDETIQQIWTKEIDSHGSLWDRIASDLRKNPIPLDSTGSFREKFLSKLIKDNLVYIMSSGSFRSYLSAKTSWNPFNRDQRIQNAKTSLYQDVIGRLRGTYREFCASGVRSVTNDPNSEPRHLYNISIKWMNSIRNGVVQSCEKLGETSKKNYSKDPRLQGYAWNRCRIQLNKLRQSTIAARF